MTVDAAVPSLLFVHAHPDDETLATGVALATYACAGADVHVLTATLGDEGEVIPADLAHLDPATEEGVDRGRALAEHRAGELDAALTALGVHGHLLGAEDSDGTSGRPRYRDSGMAGSPSAAHPWALSGVPLSEVAALVRDSIEALRPDVVVTYDAHGGYAHPDHIRVHEATRAAVAAIPEADRPDLFGVFVPQDVARADRAWLRDHVDPGAGLTLLDDSDPFPPSVVDPARITHEVIGTPEALARRDAALRAHATQVTVFDGGYHALSNDIAARTRDREWFARLDPLTGEPRPAPGADHTRAAHRPGLLGPSGAVTGGRS